MQQYSSTPTATRTTITLRLSKWHTPQVCTHCGATNPAGTATRHYFEGSHLKVICRACAMRSEFFDPYPAAQAADQCLTCGQILEDGACFNLWCPVGLANVQQAVGTGPEIGESEEVAA